MCLSKAILCIPTKAQQPIEWGFQIQNLINKHQKASSKFQNLGWSKVYISCWLSYTIDRLGLGLLQMGKCQQNKSLKSWKAFFLWLYWMWYDLHPLFFILFNYLMITIPTIMVSNKLITKRESCDYNLRMRQVYTIPWVYEKNTVSQW